MNYYSKRDKEYSEGIGKDFFIAFNAYIEELINEDFGNNSFANSFGGLDSSSGWYISEYKINNKMAQELGCKKYPFHKPDKVEITMEKTETILDLIVFFYKFISDKGENKDTRYKYTCRINELFNNFKLLYKLKSGTIISKHSDFIDKLIFNDFININVSNDLETQKLLKLAVEKFYSKNIKEQKIGLEKIVDSYQRISSWENQSDKKKSINSIINKISSQNPEIKKITEEDFQSMWKIANDFMIRHTELNKRNINDPDFLEYLFYQYYISIRFILKKYGYLKFFKEVNNKDELPW
jgi:hypothetical protein